MSGARREKCAMLRMILMKLTMLPESELKTQSDKDEMDTAAGLEITTRDGWLRPAAHRAKSIQNHTNYNQEMY